MACQYAKKTHMPVYSQKDGIETEVTVQTWKPKALINNLKNSSEISLCIGTMEPANLINANYRKLLGKACPSAN